MVSDPVSHFLKILDSTVGNLAKTATPLGLMAMGGSLRFGKAFSRLKASVACTFMKLVGYEALFLPLAHPLRIHTG